MKKRICLILIVLALIIWVVVAILQDNKGYHGRSVNVVEAGCEYVVAKTGEVLKAGAKMPKTPEYDDKYITNDYEYIFTYWGNIDRHGTTAQGWYQKVKEGNETKTEYEAILGKIAGKKVIGISFEYCYYLEKAPKIPCGVMSLKSTFRNCRNLEEAPEIPNTVINIERTFSGCEKLKAMPKLPNGILDMDYTFRDCTSLTKVSDLPCDLRTACGTFSGCSSLTEAPELPESLEDMYWMFRECRSLTKVGKIPDSVTRLTGTFWGCDLLEGVPKISN